MYSWINALNSSRQSFPWRREHQSNHLKTSTSVFFFCCFRDITWYTSIGKVKHIANLESERRDDA